jgi:predicted NBD/HSP70 family sugar kinase
MTKSGINLVDVRANNRFSILRLLNANGAMSRKDIAAELKLTPAAVTILCSELIEERLIAEKGEAESGKHAGRKKMLIAVNNRYKHIIGINIEPDFTNLNISDLTGSSVLHQRIATDTAVAADVFLKNIAHECIQMLWKANLKKEDVLGVGVGIIGSVDADHGVSKLAYGIWQNEVPVKRILENEFVLPVLVDNNVRAFVLGEILFGKTRDIDNMLFVKWGPGIGSAVVINRSLYFGENIRSSTLGHFIVERNGKLCRCGKRGCIETIACKEAVFQTIKDIAANHDVPDLTARLAKRGENLTVDNVFDYIDADDAAIRQYVDSLIDELAVVVNNAVTILSPKKVMLFGQAFENKAIFARFLEQYKQLSNESYHDGFFGKSSVMEKLNFIGPVAIVAERMFFSAASAPS